MVALLNYLQGVPLVARKRLHYALDSNGEGGDQLDRHQARDRLEYGPGPPAHHDAIASRRLLVERGLEKVQVVVALLGKRGPEAGLLLVVLLALLGA
jgi:hypothetical protein